MGRTENKRLKMMDLERLTGVGRETIRYYIREGLLPEPERPSRNVAWYDETFVDRINLIKDLQQKRFLPLRVIRALLADGAPPSEELETLGALDGKIFASETGSLAQRAARLSSVAKRTGIKAAEILEMEESGMISSEVRDGDRWLDAGSVRIVELWAKLRRAGFSEELGFGKETWSMWADFVDWLADQELRMFAHLVTGRIDADTGARMGESGIEIGGEILALMRRDKLLQRVRRENLQAWADRGPGRGVDAGSAKRAKES